MEVSQNQAADILEAALDEAFAVPAPRHTLKPEVPSTQESGRGSEPGPQQAATATASEPIQPSEGAALDDSWKEEYDAQVRSWRNQSAEAREKAEKERLKWEAIRAQEKAEAAKRKAAGITHEPAVPSPSAQGEGWEKVGVPSASGSTTAASSKPDLQSESEIVQPASTRPLPAEGLPETHSRQDTTTDEKWEDVPSVTSSFPSMSFPEHAATPPRPSQPPAPNPPMSVTLAIFDSTLSTRTRLTAFASSLAVNLLLPFVNGVMLGFGEIFAKNVVMDWLGWKGPSSVSANVGLRSSPRDIRKRNISR